MIQFNKIFIQSENHGIGHHYFCLTSLSIFQTTVLHLAANFKCSAKVVQVLIEAGADVNAVESFQMSPLHYASMRNPAIVPLLLEAGAKVDVLDNIRWSPLFYAAWYNQEASVVALMAASADPHLGRSPLTSSDVSDEMKALIKSLLK